MILQRSAVALLVGRREKQDEGFSAITKGASVVPFAW